MFNQLLLKVFREKLFKRGAMLGYLDVSCFLV